jgi:hypothetical protein
MALKKGEKRMMAPWSVLFSVPLGPGVRTSRMGEVKIHSPLLVQ